MGLILEANLPDPVGPCPWHRRWPGAAEATRDTGWGAGDGRGRPSESSFTLMEAPANLASCLMCAPFFPMMAPTAWVGMKRFTISCSGYWKGNTRQDVIPTVVAPVGTQQLPSIYHKPCAVKAKMAHGILLWSRAL